jgi:tetratricopeptide (TPR) repeat protein
LLLVKGILILAIPMSPHVLEEHSMSRSYLFTAILIAGLLVLSAITASAQTGQLRGHVLFKQADGTTAKAANAQVDVYRTDLPGHYPTKTNKNGEFVYAGLPFVGRYIIAVSMPDAAPYALGGIRAGQDIDYEIVIGPGDGRKFTEAEAKAAAQGASGGGTAASNSGESADAKAKREEIEKKNAEITEKNKKIEESNKVVTDSFRAGNLALSAKNYDEAIKQYDTGLAADAQQPALLTNKAAALKARGVDRFNAAIQTKDEAAKTSGLDSAKADFKAAADAATKAVDLLKAEPAATDPDGQKRQAANKYAALSVRAETMRLYVSKGDPSQADAGIAAFQEYIAIETDPARKARAQLDLAQMLLDAGQGDKAFAEYQKILAEKPDDPDANLGAGLALFSTGEKAKYQDAANYLQKFVDKAPEDHKFKNDAKAILAELKNTENVVPEKTSTPSRRRKP